MADKDKFTKVADSTDLPINQGILSLADLQAAKNKSGRSTRKQQKKDRGALCCNYFSIKTGFILYGIFDIIYTIVISAIIITILARKKKVKAFWYNSLVLALPNSLTFIYVMVVKKAIAHKIYTYILAVKLGIVALSLPLLFMYENRDELYPKFCKN